MSKAYTDLNMNSKNINNVGHIIPASDNTVDLGTSTVEFRDLFLDGTAHIDTLDVDRNADVHGTLDVDNWSTFEDDMEINGDLEVSGCITGTIDPDSIQYDYYSRQNIIDDCKLNIPVGKKCVVTFVNEDTELLEVYYPHKGEFKDIAGVLLEKLDKVQVNPLVKTRYYINPTTGEWMTRTSGVKPRYKKNPNVITDSKLGVFQDKATRLSILSKEEALIYYDDRL